MLAFRHLPLRNIHVGPATDLREARLGCACARVYVRPFVGLLLLGLAGCGATYKKEAENPARYLIQCGDEPNACHQVAKEVCEERYFVIAEGTVDGHRFVPIVGVGSDGVRAGVGVAETKDHAIRVGCGAQFGIRP